MKITIGVDEAGRGCLWGSVFAGAVALPESLLNEETMTKEEKFLLRDSKKLSEKRRNEAAAMIYERAIATGIGEATSEEIDRMNILNATHLSMHRAIDQCYRELIERYPEAIVDLAIDGNSFRVYNEPITDKLLDYECIVGGDASHRAIAAASILAKTSRDAFVKNTIKVDPTIDTKWKMGKHKGYGTKDHMIGLETYGAHSLHRKSYAPIRKIIGNGVA